MIRIDSLLIIGLVSVVFMSACGIQMDTNTSSEEDTLSNSRFNIKEIASDTFVLIDKETSVQYLKVIRHFGAVAVTPLYQTDGKLYISEEVADNRFAIERLDSEHYLITDNETKVQYLKVAIVPSTSKDSGISLIPLLQPTDGLLIKKP